MLSPNTAGNWAARLGRTNQKPASPPRQAATTLWIAIQKRPQPTSHASKTQCFQTSLRKASPRKPLCTSDCVTSRTPNACYQRQYAARRLKCGCKSGVLAREAGLTRFRCDRRTFSMFQNLGRGIIAGANGMALV